jgi:hypothetical protein
MKIIVVDVERKLGVEVFSTNLRLGTLSFTRSYVQEAELMPNEAPNMRFEWVHPISLAVAVESHTFRHSNSSSY